MVSAIEASWTPEWKRLWVRLLAIVARIASPSAPPTCCEVLIRPEANPARLAKIRTPILIGVGDRDDIAGGAPELVELIPSARLVTLAGRDHMSAVVAREFKQAAMEFLTEVD